MKLKVPRDGGEEHLKYLDFVQSAVIYFVVCFSTVYEYAKENAGPLKPGVHTVESTVKTVIGPVCERFHDVPYELLKFIDLKVFVFLFTIRIFTSKAGVDSPN